ncbi:lysosomal alpha-glucosidase isoform X2 [Phyllopteryx taeniolatus]|uniref:lysosomal alpha-glucosidase isoform X2 n=1 Tax=Phyllopteryx taeniolatus TaxID=161469 RepID=UPI002AD2D351|nr:lysosomal alpha-glucosidase isoform X2 [Phyllopteryx taeniolatus]
MARWLKLSAAALLAVAFSTLCHFRHSLILNSRLAGNGGPPKPKLRRTLRHRLEPADNAAEARPPRCVMPPERRFDCGRDRALGRRECERRACCYAPLDDSSAAPWCFYPHSYPGYQMGVLTPTLRGRAATLTRASASYLPRDVAVLHLEETRQSAGCLRLTLKDPWSERYEVELPGGVPQGKGSSQDALYTIAYESNPFGFIVRRASNGRVIMNSTVAPLLFAEQYLQLSTTLASSLVSGLGEHYTSLLLDLNWTSLTLWNRDMAPHAGANLYGSHPFYVVQEEDGLAHGVFLLNSNAIEVVLQPLPALTWVSTGGILDLYVFMGPDAQTVIRQYLRVIGYPMMPPYWSLGFHLCRWGYKSTNATRQVAQRMHDANFPMDVQWNDLDYASQGRVFTKDPLRFGDLKEMVDEFHQRGIKYVLILDPGISATSPPGTYQPFDDGLKRDVFIQNATGHLLLGKVWPGFTAFPDFTNPETRQWWQDCIVDFYSEVPLDGLWIDMNEPTSFVSGSTEGCPETELENPPYTPRVLGGRLSSWTLCMSARQKRSAHYDLHNVYGLTQAFATHSALVKARGKRPFVLSRSSFPSIGRFSGVWTGDVRSDWEQLAYSIPSVLRFGLFGVPLAGADVCGFGGDASEELCVRWMQLGAFYPFMRNHNDRPNAPQEPYVFGQKAQAAMRGALRLRYSLLPFLYTLFHHAHASGDTVARPLFMEFPADPRCRVIDRQFLWGSSVLVSPVLEAGATEVSAYLPPGTWYNLRSVSRATSIHRFIGSRRHVDQNDRSVALRQGRPTYSEGEDVLLSAPLDTVNIHVREGHIIPRQEPALTSAVSRTNAFFLTVALSADGTARGDLFWDDGDSVDTFQTGNYSYVLFTAGQSQVASEPIRLNGALDGLVLGGTRVFGVPWPPRYVAANGEEVKDFTYNADTKVLKVSSLALPMSKMFTVQWALTSAAPCYP